MTAMDNAWAFLKDYEGIVPGTEGRRGPNTGLNMRELGTEDAAIARWPVGPVLSAAGGLTTGAIGGLVAGPVGAVAGAGLGAAYGGLVAEKIKGRPVRERQAQFAAQQRMFRQKMREWYALKRRVQSGTDRFPEGWEEGPRFQVGQQTYPVSQHLWQPGHERQLVVGRPTDITSKCGRCKGTGQSGEDTGFGTISGDCADCGGKGKITRPRVKFDKPGHLEVGKQPVPGRTFFGPGGYLEGVDNFLQGGMANKDRDAARRAAFLSNKLSEKGWLYPEEMKFLQAHYATDNPMLVAGAADKLGLIREKTVRAKKEEAADAEDPDVEEGEDAAKKTLADKAKAKKTGKISVTDVDPEWHERFEKQTAAGHATTDGSTDTYHNMHGDTYGKKMKAAWPKGFDLDAPESGKWKLKDFVKKKLFAGDKDLSKYWNTMQKVLPHLDQEGMVKWMRSHPGWEGVPDDFEWKEAKPAKPKKGPSGGVTGGKGGKKSDDTLHQINPMEQAWTLLKMR